MTAFNDDDPGLMVVVVSPLAITFITKLPAREEEPVR